MINSATIVGRLIKDVDLRYSQSGKAISNFTVASNRPFKNADGNREADFINVVQFGKGAELTAQYMRKGSQIGVTGRIQTRNYENNEGRRIYVTEVVADQVAFLETKKSNNQQSGNTGQFNQGQQNGFDDPFANDGQPIDISDDMLPF